ncbi:MAG: AAA family ATPase [Proteobacteria bacterium]|nr:AAA family ATPase [Pseudomonadota bacterium]
MARTELAKARHLLSGRDPDDGLMQLPKLAKRYARLRWNGLLADDDIEGCLWDAAESTGLVEAHSADTVQNVIASAIMSAEATPYEDDGKPRPAVQATPYIWKPPEASARRDWLYGYLLVRKFVTATISPGGVGKSSLIAVEALAKVSGKDLLGVTPPKQLRVWLWNLEDPQEETERKIQAAALRYKLTPDDIGDRLFVDSGRDQPLVIAQETKNGATIMRPVVDGLTEEIRSRRIDVVIVDPFVSCFQGIGENDNAAMDLIVKEWGKVADKGNCAVHLVDHTRKMGGTESEVTVESSRGAKSKTDACRVVRAVNRMSKEEGERAGVENHRLFFRTFNDKANLQPPADKSDWFKLESVDLGNGPLGSPGDSVGIVTQWKWPDPLDGITGADFDKVARVIRSARWRENVQATAWVGKAVAEALDMDAGNKADKTKIIAMLNVWRAAGSLVVVEGEDEKRNIRKFVEVREDDE